MVPKTWMVRCEGGSLFDEFVERGIIALGGPQPEPDLTGVSSWDEIQERCRTVREWPSAHRLGYVTGVLNRFIIEMSPGHRVLTCDPTQRVCAVSIVDGPYRFAPSVVPDKQHLRDVKWTNERIGRDDLSVSTRQSLTSMVSVSRSPRRSFCDADSWTMS